jgi:molybdenum cofactor cytidylyltransferase
MAVTAGLILAAGGGSRFGGSTHKLLQRIDGVTLVRRACEVALAGDLADLLVVTGAVDLSGELPPGCTQVLNPRWAEGLATSLQAGVEAAGRAEHEAVVVGLADQPALSPAAWRAVAAADRTPVAVATYGGERGHPVRLAAEVWPLLPTSGDRGAGPLMASRPELVTEVPCSSGAPADIDTAEDLDQFSSPTSSE